MIEILCSKSSITADTTFRKFYPAGGTNSNTRTINLEKNQMKPNEASRQSNCKIHINFRGPPHQATRDEVGRLRDGPRGLCRWL